MPTEVRARLAGIMEHTLAYRLARVLPKQPSIGRFLAQMDRGDFPRPVDDWRQLFTATFEPVLFGPYSVGVAGVIFWNVGYFKGKVRWRS